ncbi:unnamed protein product, partial [Prunus brigantina]
EAKATRATTLPPTNSFLHIKILYKSLTCVSHYHHASYSDFVNHAFILIAIKVLNQCSSSFSHQYAEVEDRENEPCWRSRAHARYISFNVLRISHVL